MFLLVKLFLSPGSNDPEGELENTVDISNDFLLFLLIFISLVFLLKYLNNKKVSA